MIIVIVRDVDQFLEEGASQKAACTGDKKGLRVKQIYNYQQIIYIKITRNNK